MKRTGAVLGMVAVVTVVLTGCAGPDAEAQGTDERESLLTSVVEPTWTIDVEPIGTSSVTVAYDTVFAYVKTAEADVTLAAYDASNGEVRWMRPASITNRVEGSLYPMFTGPDDQLLLASVGEPLSQPDGNWVQDLALLEPTTGQVKAASSGLWISSIWDCDLDGGVCFWGNTPGQDDDTYYQLTVDGGVEPHTRPVANYVHSRALGGGVWGVEDEAGVQSVVRFVNGAEVWKIPAADVVGADGVIIGSLGGWYAFEDEGVLLYNSTGVKSPSTYVVPAADERAGVIDLETGAVLWRTEGQVVCGPHGETPILCSGEFSFRRDAADGPVEVETGDVTVTGIDPRTGATKWESDFADLSGLANKAQGNAVKPFGPYWPVRTADGIIVIDRATGEAADLSGNQTIGCSVPAEASFREFSVPTYGIISEVTGAAIQSCTADGASSDPATFTQAVVFGSGSQVLVDGEWKGGEDAPLSVVRTENALLGYVR